MKALFDLQTAPFRMAARGLKIWMLAELDYARLALKRLFVGKATAEAVPQQAAAED